MDLRVRILSSTVDSNRIWPLKVNREITFCDLTAMLRAQFGLNGQRLLYFCGRQQIGAADLSQQRVSNFVSGSGQTENILLVKEVNLIEEEPAQRTGNYSVPQRATWSPDPDGYHVIVEEEFPPLSQHQNNKQGGGFLSGLFRSTSSSGSDMVSSNSKRGGGKKKDCLPDYDLEQDDVSS